MTVTNYSPHESNQASSEATKAAEIELVSISESGRLNHELLTTREYQHLSGGQMTLFEALTQPDAADFDFDPLRMKHRVGQALRARRRIARMHGTPVYAWRERQIVAEIP